MIDIILMVTVSFGIGVVSFGLGCLCGHRVGRKEAFDRAVEWGGIICSETGKMWRVVPFGNIKDRKD